MKRKLKYILIILLNFISVTLVVSIHFLYKNFGNLTMEEIVFHLKVPLDGTDSTVINEFINVYIPIIIGATTVLSVLFIYPIVSANRIRNKRRKNAQNGENKAQITENQKQQNDETQQNNNKIEVQPENINTMDQTDAKEDNTNGFKVVKDNYKNCKKRKGRKTKKAIVKFKRANVNITVKIILSLTIFVISVTYAVNTTDVIKYISNQLNESFLIENEYVDPRDVSITFPEKKRNLIYIYLESMESTYSSKEEGGALDVNLIPELTELAKENINFSNTDKIGGAQSITGTGWTIAAMVAQSTGVPLKIGMEVSNTSSMDEFLPGAYGIGEILEQEGYNNFLMIGSDAQFASRDKFFEQHGNYEIWDLNTAIEEGKMTEEEKVWWGYSDKNLFAYAKEEITKLSRKGEPFNFTMLTVDTHFPDGYICEDCENDYTEKYYNVISCSSKQVYEFVSWIQEQDFYEDTTIVISGDHLTMQTGYFDDLETTRTVYNVIINSAIETNNSKNRTFTTLDMLPTTLAALGVRIEGDRLGIGTNLFSDRQTLAEEMGLEYLDEELKKSSKFYNKNFLNY